MAKSLNLLRYPRRMPTLDAALWRPGLVALLVGVLAGGLWGGWQHQRQEEWTVLRARLRAQTQALAGQQTQAVDQQAKARLQQAFVDRAQAWQSQRERLMHLHATLTEQAKDAGLRVERWQSDGRKLVLQAWLPRAERVPLVMARLSAAWPQGWTLQSLGDRAASGGDAGIDVVFEAPWGDAAQAGGKSSP